MAVSKCPAQYLIDAHNIRITRRDNGTLLTITNEKGTFDLSKEFIGTCLGYAILNNQLVVFTTDNGTDRIYKATFLNSDDNSDSSEAEPSDNPNPYNPDNPDNPDPGNPDTPINPDTPDNPDSPSGNPYPDILDHGDTGEYSWIWVYNYGDEGTLPPYAPGSNKRIYGVDIQGAIGYAMWLTA